MVGDDMAILSGGMYGNPESAYTKAMPVSWSDKVMSGVSFGGNVVSTGLKFYNKYLGYKAVDEQIGADLHALEVEKAYNVKNYKQQIADTLASNKISFYSSGLDINTGTARNVIESNRTAGLENLAQIEARYNTQIQNLKDKRNANEKAKIAGMMSVPFGG